MSSHPDWLGGERLRLLSLTDQEPVSPQVIWSNPEGSATQWDGYNMFSVRHHPGFDVGCVKTEGEPQNHKVPGVNIEIMEYLRKHCLIYELMRLTGAAIFWWIKQDVCCVHSEES